MERDEEDELLERLRQTLARRVAEHDKQVVAQLETSFEDDGEDDGKVSPDGPPRPLYWHPFYRDRAGLIDWLNSRDQTPLYLAIPRRIRLVEFREGDALLDAPRDLSLERLTLTKNIAAGPAPYVGEPFCYRWNIATDQLGRSIAGEARIQYFYGFPLGEFA